MEPFQVLGNLYIDDSRVRQNINLLSYPEWLWDYRTPSVNIGAVDDPSINTWHKDSDGSIPALILWASQYPTEILLPDGSIIAGDPYDVVLIDNTIVQHRVPEEFIRRVNNFQPTNRYFIRGYIERAATERSIQRWREELRSKEHFEVSGVNASRERPVAMNHRVFDCLC